MSNLPNSPKKSGNKSAGSEHHILDALPVSALVTRVSEGTVLFANPASARLLGYPDASALLGRQSVSFYWDAQERQTLLERLHAEGSLENYEVRFRRADDSMIWVDISVHPFEFEGKKDVLLSTIVDITERKQAEQAIHKSEERFRLFSEVTTEGLVFHEKGVIVDVNPALLNMFGYSDASALVGKSVLNFIAPESHDFVIKQMQSLGAAPYEALAVRQDGTVFPIEATPPSDLYEYHGHQVRIATIRDITKRKQAEARLQSIIENAPEAIVVVDLTTGLFIEPNENAVKLYGLSREELVKVGPAHMSPPTQPDGRPSTEKAMEKINDAMQGKTPIFEWMHRNVRGEDIPCEVRLTRMPGDLPLVRASITDITERKQAEQAIHKSEERFRLFSEVTSEGLVFHEKGVIVDVNPALLNMFGYSDASELVGKSVLNFIAPESHDFVIKQMQLSGAAPYEALAVRKDGTVFPVEATPPADLYEYQGHQVRMASIRDITKRKKLEGNINEAFERRGHQVQISTEISQEIASATEISDLFDRVVTLTKERLGYYHTQLLRYEPGQDAVVLINGYGETGKKMLASGHTLPMGSGLIGAAAVSGTTILRPTLAEEPDWQPNPLLPDTKGEIAVPIKFQDKIMGVLDVQSNVAGALSEDDRLLLEGLCGQIAVAIEQTRLRQEMAERLEEVNRLYRTMSHEGWETYRSGADLPKGFVFDQAGVKSVDETDLSEELFAGVQLAVPGGEVVGSLAVSDDPQHPISPEDRTFLMQVSEQIALALESARLAAQTQSALEQSESLFDASRRMTQAANLQELVKVIVETLNIPVINRAGLEAFSYDADGEMIGMTVVANWNDDTGRKAEEVGTYVTADMLKVVSLFLSPTPLFFNDAFNDERMDPAALQMVKALNYRAFATLPLFLGTRQLGLLILTAEEPHNFTQDEIRLFSAMAPQIATVMENRRQFEQAQQQAEREAMLNAINQKIQSATTVEAVLQIAARELGHALGAPRTIAQLSMKDKN